MNTSKIGNGSAQTVLPFNLDSSFSDKKNVRRVLLISIEDCGDNCRVVAICHDPFFVGFLALALRPRPRHTCPTLLPSSFTVLRAHSATTKDCFAASSSRVQQRSRGNSGQKTVETYIHQKPEGG